MQGALREQAQSSGSADMLAALRLERDQVRKKTPKPCRSSPSRLRWYCDVHL